MTRIAIVSTDKCKPKKCRQECKRSCPVVRMGPGATGQVTGKLCIEVSPSSKIAQISEELCIGCGICVKKCPFEAVQIINLPSNLNNQTTHRYSQNSFKLHRLPTPRPGEVLGRCILVRVNCCLTLVSGASHTHYPFFHASPPPFSLQVWSAPTESGNPPR